MLDARVYRAAFVPVVLALIVVAFSLQDRPAPITTTLAADAFDGVRASADLHALAQRFPDRRPGSAGDQALARLVAARVRASGFASPRVQTFDGETIDGKVPLQTVRALRPGTSSRRIVVVAHRDARGRGAAAELSGTESLLELARVFAGRTLNRSLELVSTSGGAGGAGAAQLAAEGRGRIDAVIVLGDLAGNRDRRPVGVPWSNGDGLAPQRLERTLEASVAAETGAREDRIGAAARFARLALPLTLGEQGPLNAGGIPAVLLQVSGEGGPAASDPVSRERFTNYGRAALRTITALDAGPDITSGPEHGVVLRGRVVPGWAVRLLGGALLVPALIAAVDGLARTRRRREPVGMWVRWVLAGALPFALAALTLPLLRMTDALDAAPPEPVAPAAIPLHGAGMAAVAAVLLVLALGWIGIRPVALRLLGVHGDPGGAGAGAALALVAVGIGVVVWAANPFAAAVLLPGVHVAVLLGLASERPRRWAGAVALAVMVAPAALLAVYYAHAFGMGPIDLAWAAALLVAGGRIGVLDVLAWSLLLAALAGLLAHLRARPRHPPPVTEFTVRGPATYAGPGSLGGTESTLPR